MGGGGETERREEEVQVERNQENHRVLLTANVTEMV